MPINCLSIKKEELQILNHVFPGYKSEFLVIYTLLW